MKTVEDVDIWKTLSEHFKNKSLHIHTHNIAIEGISVVNGTLSKIIQK